MNRDQTEMSFFVFAVFIIFKLISRKIKTKVDLIDRSLLKPKNICVLCKEYKV